MANTLHSLRDRVRAPFRAPSRSFTTASPREPPWLASRNPIAEAPSHSHRPPWLSQDVDHPLDDFGMIVKPICMFTDD